MIWQVITTMSLLPIILRLRQSHYYYLYILEVFGILNLAYFGSVYTPICLHPKLNAMHLIALDYVVAVNPMFLIIVTYVAVGLHDRGPVIVSFWKPVYKLFTCIRKTWDIRGSLIQAFVTALILSYVKILNTSLKLLKYVHPMNVEGHHINQR